MGSNQSAQEYTLAAKPILVGQFHGGDSFEGAPGAPNGQKKHTGAGFDEKTTSNYVLVSSAYIDS